MFSCLCHPRRVMGWWVVTHKWPQSVKQFHDNRRSRPTNFFRLCEGIPYKNGLSSKVFTCTIRSAYNCSKFPSKASSSSISRSAFSVWSAPAITARPPTQNCPKQELCACCRKLTKSSMNFCSCIKHEFVTRTTDPHVWPKRTESSKVALNTWWCSYCQCNSMQFSFGIQCFYYRN